MLRSFGTQVGEIDFYLFNSQYLNYLYLFYLSYQFIHLFILNSLQICAPSTGLKGVLMKYSQYLNYLYLFY